MAENIGIYDLAGKSAVPNAGWLLRSKLEAPRILINVVDRTALQGAENNVVLFPLTSIVAPAGFGKSTLLAQWRCNFLKAGHTVAWLSLDEADGEPSQLLSYLIATLSKAGVEVGQMELLAEQGLSETSIQATAENLLEIISGHPAEVVLMLDDMHRVEAGRALNLIRMMVHNAPKNLHIIINARQGVALSLAEFIAAGKAQEVDAEQLRFDLKETGQAVGDSSDTASLKALHEKTEGWPVAVQLAKLALAKRPHSDNFSTLISGQTGHLSNYLAEQIISGLEPAQINLLMKTALLERFNAALANAICGITNGAQLIDSLNGLSALLVPIDADGVWFRYHHLFADFLKNLLNYTQPDETKRIHIAAADWFEQEGLIAEAVRHARLAGDVDRSAAIIENAGGWALVLYGGIGFLRNLLKNLTYTELGKYPRLLLAQSYLDIKDGHLANARRCYEDALALADKDFGHIAEFSTPLNRDILNLSMLLQVYEDRLDGADQAGRMQHYRNVLPEGDALAGGLIACTQTLTEIAHGRLAEALMTVRHGLRDMRRADSTLGVNYCYLHWGLADFYLGNFQHAEASLWEARELAADNFGADSGLHAMVDVLLGGLEYWRGTVEEHSGLSTVFLAAAKHVEQFDGWFEIYAMSLDVTLTAALDQGQLELARASVERIEAVYESRNIRRLKYLTLAGRLRIALAESNHDIAERLASQLRELMPLGCWRSDPYLWRPYQSAGLALAEVYSIGKRRDAIAVIDDLLACTAAFGAHFFCGLLYLRKARLLDLAGDRRAALTQIQYALDSAVNEGMRRPFLIVPDLLPLLRAAIKHGREEAWSSRALALLSSCVAAYQEARFSRKAADQIGLSKRELDVLEQLAVGGANKEIARALDMTENTVKFHLKNLFKKLRAENRSQAIELAKSRNIIS